MAVGQLPDQVGEFARYLRDLLGRLDQATGWCGVFWQRDPDGMRACLDGVEVPPWDVVQALLHDLAADRGIPEAERETHRARTLHRASLTAYDSRPGARELLGDRLDMMLTERRLALEREADLSRLLSEATAPDDADRISLDLAWVRDDHERATARCAELQERLARLESADRPTWANPGTTPTRPRPDAAPNPDQPHHPRGARYAGLQTTDTYPEPAAPPTPTPATPSTPRGARYEPPPPEAPTPEVPPPAPTPHAKPDHAKPDHTTQTVQALLHLRREGRTGEAHAVLVEAAARPPHDLPPLAAELHRAGLAADWATLLWEAASLPPDRLVALADALAGAGRADDCRKLLRQGVARPAPEIAEAILALIDAGREREARALLDSYLRVRTPEDAARCAHTDPRRLVPLLLETARGVSEEHRWDLVHALRVAGFNA
ncbi:tetratricopeptide repeat protein [Streptomyces sp. 135]|uniref:tetratricopeptide repeat protein n=1 Tax=Streptomyces sp. 135 TaxID=2838850 RepID=UPI001CC11DA4|nr:tetratricopeptide repeat protein [Streptomyces sp. 135]